MVPTKKNTTVKGLYMTTHCAGGASDFVKYFTVKDSICAIKRYQVVFQCRVQPEKFTEHKSAVRVVLTWRVFDEKAIGQSIWEYFYLHRHLRHRNCQSPSLLPLIIIPIQYNILRISMNRSSDPLLPSMLFTTCWVGKDPCSDKY